MGHHSDVADVSDWIYEDNLQRVAFYVSALMGYEWDEQHAGLLEAGLAATDWFSYQIGQLTISITRDHSNGTLAVTFNGEFDDVFAARLETMMHFN